MSKMNVDSDRAATLELTEYSDIHSIVPFDPCSKVLIHIGGKTVTRDLEQNKINKCTVVLRLSLPSP